MVRLKMTQYCLACVLLVNPFCYADEEISQTINKQISQGWKRGEVRPTALADDAEFVRRIYLDLLGRIPQRKEAQDFCRKKDGNKRRALIDELLESPEFSQHWRENLNLLLMGGPVFGGDGEWRNWLEQCLRTKKGWDFMVREILVARPKNPENAGASHFLASRFAQGPSGLDLATRDTARFFFGVDVQCARCHTHPEVRVWKQSTYWGMAAFWNRSYSVAIKNKTFVAEKSAGEMDYSTKSQKALVAEPTFLTGEKVLDTRTVQVVALKPSNKTKIPIRQIDADYLVSPEPETTKEKTRVAVPKYSRREKLAEVALDPKNPYFKKAAVNYFWSMLMGRGFVEPRDQMHEGNPPSHPELLQYLANDFATHQFDYRRLLRGIANSVPYQLSSNCQGKLLPELYASGPVKPLSLEQLCLSLLVGAGYGPDFSSTPRRSHGNLRAQLETQNSNHVGVFLKNLDRGSEMYQPEIREALFESNSSAFADYIAQGRLVQELTKTKESDGAIQDAYWTVLTRAPEKMEMNKFNRFLAKRMDKKPKGFEQIVWVLLTSPEFRFNH